MAEVELPVDSLAGGSSELKFDSLKDSETSYPKENGVLDENGYVKVIHNPSSSDSESDNSSIMSDNEDMSILDASTDFDAQENKQVVRDVALDFWAQETFVPACVSLLDHCANENVVASAVQDDLQRLAGIVQGFCDQHQTSRVISGSSTISRIKTPPAIVSSSLTRSANFDFSEDRSPLTDEHVSVTVLHSAVESLISPLLTQISQEFTFAMCSEIVEMLRKLILQVEGCLSFLNSSKEVNIYGEIFTEQRKQQLRDAVAATPPPAYKVHSLCRDKKMSNADHRQFVRLSGSHVVSPTQAAMIPASKAPVKGTQSLSYSADKASMALAFHGKARSMDTERNSDGDPLYFRPGRMRRTTVSLSHKEVANLFLSKRRSTSASVDSHAVPVELPETDGVTKSYHYSPMLRRRYTPLDDHGEKLRRLHKELLKGFGHQTSSADEEEGDEEDEVEDVQPSKDGLLNHTIVELEEDPVLPSPSTTTESTSTATTIDSSSTTLTDTPNLDVDDSSSRSERNSTFSSSGSRSSGAYDHADVPKAFSPENNIARRHSSPPPPSSSAPTTPSRKSGIFKKVQRVVSNPHSFEYNVKRSPSRNKSRKSIRPTSTFFDIDLSLDNQIAITVELNKKRSSFSELQSACGCFMSDFTPNRG